MSGVAQPQGSQHSFGKTSRLLTARDYSRVFDGAEARASHKHVLLLAKQNDRPGHRLGLVVAKKNVRQAVQRNRVKRLAREMFRQAGAQPPYMDVVLLARRGIDQLDNAELSSILRGQWRKLARRVSEADTSESRGR
ncbi:ribonuclease P protein component [Parahaliea aestuarii]|uniref:Ribonuclease P protein component n=1 Tax=Parahaliea aestuarii TaxID=1852021 RepID=A0A5C8ZV41_9GAMM|nr:ribonuclease P protein component [Parahaliea aestuarii]TXS92358.1 ribonuclease P protein component [Parahaliea aestuarii]